MKKEIVALGLCMVVVLACAVGIVSCGDDNDDPNPLHSPSYRDRVYTGEKLAVYLDDKLVSSVVSADVQSEVIPHSGGSGIEPDGTIVIDPDYDTKVVIDGFPHAGIKTTITTVMKHMQTFEGDVSVNGAVYSYVGEFTGGPLDLAKDQGCIIHFTTKK